jgi:hypothetical protein
MHFRGIDFPDTLLDAQSEGRLAVFAGAGVSMPPPANYPSFEGLALQIADGTLRLQKHEPLDRFLGHLKARGTAVHRRAHEILNNPASQPTPLHYELLKLFPSISQLRLVTTNFDPHFTTAATSTFPDVETFYAPALPLGHQFNGIVYLHGSVAREPERFILTDDDFGRAYLIEGWATRFLQAMFSKYTVLFVGYSHNDVVMNYLARGLPPVTSAPRFALTSESGDDLERWKFLGITPLNYPLKRKPHKHRVLGEAIADWVNYAKSGVLDHEQQIRAIVESPPPLDRETADRIERALHQHTTAQFFTRHAKTPKWLLWAENKPPFKSLFQAEADLSPVAIELAHWFAKSFACQHPGVALSVVQRQGQRLHPTLWGAIAVQLILGQPAPAQETLAKWVIVLLRSQPYQSNLLSRLLRRCQSQRATTALLLFEHLTRPYLNLKPNFLPTDTEDAEYPSVELAFHGDNYWLKDAWQKIFHPHLEAFAERLEPILTSHLQQAHLLLRAAGKADDHWDPFSYGRSAIEAHEQDRYGQPPEMLIDAARDVLEWMLVHKPTQAQTVMNAWSDSNVPILWRLAIHGIAESNFQSANDKLTWLQGRKWLYTFGLKHEIFRLLERAYPQASECCRRAFVEHASQGPQGQDAERLDEKTRQHYIYQVLFWLHRVASTCPFAAAQFESIQRAYPDFQPSEHPDFYSWMTLGGGEPQSSVPVEELLEKNPQQEIEWFLNYQGENVAEAAARSYDWSWQFVEGLRSQAAWTSKHWQRIFRGWHNSALTEEQWSTLLTLLNECSELSTFAHPIADFLRTGIVKEHGKLPSASIPLAQEVARALWRAHPGEVLDDGPAVEWLGKAINHPGGMLVEFWLYGLSRQHADAGDNWTGIPAVSKSFFHTVLTELTPSAQLGRVILASRLYFLFTLDADWTMENILPLLDWSFETRRAEQAWHGFLTWGHWDETLLPRLMPLYRKTYPHVARLGHLRGQFSLHLADIALFSLHHPLQGTWFDEFLLTVAPEDRKSWASYIRHRLQSLREDTIQNLWERWMKKYWERRLTGVPLPIDTGELGEMVEWSLHLGPMFPQAVEKICRSKASHLENQFIYHSLAETNYATAHPVALTQLLKHLLRASQQPFFQCEDAENLVRNLIQPSVATPDLAQLCDDLARLGCPRAAEIRGLLQNR